MFSKLDFTPQTKDLFWEEKIKRSIKDSNDMKEVKEIATLLAKIATQRAGMVSGLTKALMDAEFPLRPAP
jgi:G:T-mismatch repair DNA endonuclease (very short patch repair protein)